MTTPRMFISGMKLSKNLTINKKIPTTKTKKTITARKKTNRKIASDVSPLINLYYYFCEFLFHESRD
jgi:hypothetical protein